MSKNRRRRGYTLFGLPEQVLLYILPWAVLAGIWPVSAGLYFLIGTTSNAALWASFLALGFGYLVHVTWKLWGLRRKETRTMATAFAIGVLTWALFAVTIRPWQADIARAYGLGGLVLCTAWCIRHAAIAGVSDHDRSHEDGEEDGLLKRIRVFKNAKVNKVDETDDQLSVKIDLEPGVTAKEAQGAREEIASVARIGADDVKVLKTKGNEGQVNLAFTRAVDTSQPLVYKGPLHLGKSCADYPVWIGPRTDGSDINLWLVGSNDPKNPRPLAHTKCTGMSGAGKTETVGMIILRMREFVDIVPVVADPAKFAQSFGDIEEALGLAAKDATQSKQLVRNLIEVIKYRAGLFGALTRADGGKGYKEWVSELWTLHGIPALFVDIEEATDIVTGVGDDLDEVARKLRSVGIHLLLSMQTMPWDNIDRKTRGQFPQSLAHGQSEMQDAKYALHADTLEAGADPTKWRNDSPGSLYAEVTGTDKEHWPVDGQALYMTPADKANSIAATREYWATMDQGTYAILSRGIVAAPESPFDQEDAMEYDPDDMDEYASEETIRDLTCRDGIDTSVPLARPTGMQIQFADPIDQDRMTTEDARAELLNRIRILASGSEKEVTYQSMEDLPVLVGRKPGWVYNEFERLATEGVLRRTTPPRSKKAAYEITEGLFAGASQ